MSAQHATQKEQARGDSGTQEDGGAERSSDAELQAVYSYIPVGKNISAVHSVLIGMTIKIGSLTGP